VPVERRADFRVEVLAQVRVMKGAVSYVMDVRNISTSGMFVATGSLDRFPWLRAGQPVEANLFVADELDNLRIEGEIVRLVGFGPADKQGFGVRFSDLDGEAAKTLHDLVHRARQKSIIPPPLPGRKE
jgi:hypothetical protein